MQPASLKWECISSFSGLTQDTLMDDNVSDGTKYFAVTLGTVNLIMPLFKTAVFHRLPKISTGKQHMATDLPLVSSCSKQTEEMKDTALCLYLLRNGTVVLKTIALYHLSKTFINIIWQPKGKGTNTTSQQSGDKGSRVRSAQFASERVIFRGHCFIWKC